MIGIASIASVPAASASRPHRGSPCALRRRLLGIAALSGLAALAPASAAAPDAGASARRAGKGAPVPSVSILARKEVVAFLPFPGQPVTYTITLSNVGTGDQADNPGDELTDVLPPLLTLTSVVASSGSPIAFLGTNTVTWNGPLPSGSSVTIAVSAQIVPTAFEGQVVSNQGTVSFDANEDGVNEATVLTDTNTAPGIADPTVFAVQGPDTGPGIPTLSGAGLALLALALAVPAVALIRRRGRA
jgi:uncharacterized repeat protein (TIGR01451 family)